MYSRTFGHVGEYYGPNFSCTESTSYPEKKKKLEFMNFSQKYMGSVFSGHPVHICMYICVACIDVYIFICVFASVSACIYKFLYI